MTGSRRVWALRLVLCLGSVLVALGAAELLLRVLYTEIEVNGNYWGRGAFVAFPGAGYRHAPGFRGRAVRPGVFDVAIDIDREGLRQADLGAQLARPHRLLVLGDSFPFGLGVEADESLPARLAVLLEPDGVGVVNGAQTGYDVAQSVAWGTHLVERYHPDAVLLTLFLSNDVLDGWSGGGPRVAVVDGYRLAGRRWPRGALFDALRTHSYLWMRLAGTVGDRWRQGERRKRFREAYARDPEAALAPTLDPLLALRDLCTERGVGFATVLIPYSKGPTAFDQPVRDALHRERVPLFDLTGVLSVDQHYLRGDGHWNAAGHAAAARWLAPKLRPLPTVPGRSLAAGGRP
jgi:lysophospholipase L1-like esterase